MIDVLRKRANVLGLTVVAVGILLSACGTGTGYGSTGAPRSGPAPTGGATVVGTRSIPGIGTVLDDSKGLTLYHLTTDTSTKSTCSGSCAQVWPPLLTTNGVPKAPSGVTGTFGTIERPGGGSQVTFNGMPLYTFAGDSGPGQASGQGIDSFFAVTT